MQYAARLCKKFGIPRRIVRVRWDKPTLVIPKERSVEEIRQSVSSGFLPGRNAVFLTLAAAEAAGVSAKEIWIGVNSIDYSGYPDCRAEFIDAFQIMLNEAIPNAPKVIAPLQDLSKPQIAKLALQLGLSREQVWSCYTPERVGRRLRPCGKCDACVLNDYAWTGAKDVKLMTLNV
jgi:7-cyano-7-deazaguanine synthase